MDARWKREFATDTRALQHWCVHKRGVLRCEACKAYRLRAKPWLRRALPGLVTAHQQWPGWPWARSAARAPRS